MIAGADLPRPCGRFSPVPRPAAASRAAGAGGAAAVAADPDVALVVDGDAVVRRPASRSLARAAPVPIRLPSWSNSSTGGAGVQHSPPADSRRRSSPSVSSEPRAVHDPDMVAAHRPTTPMRFRAASDSAAASATSGPLQSAAPLPRRLSPCQFGRPRPNRLPAPDRPPAASHRTRSRIINFIPPSSEVSYSSRAEAIIQHPNRPTTFFAVAKSVAVALCAAFPFAARLTISRTTSPHRLSQARRPAAQMLVRVPLQSIRDVVFPERGPGYLDLEHATPILARRGAAMDRRLHRAVRGRVPFPKNRTWWPRAVSLESDRSFASYENAVAHLKVRRSRAIPTCAWNQVMLDVCSTTRSRRRVGVFDPPRPGAARRPRADSAAVLPPGGAVRAFEFTGDPGLVRSIRAGTRRPCVSSNWGSSTSSTAPTICCSCSAWSSRSAASAACRRSSPRLPSRTRSR